MRLPVKPPLWRSSAASATASAALRLGTGSHESTLVVPVNNPWTAGHICHARATHHRAVCTFSPHAPPAMQNHVASPARRHALPAAGLATPHAPHTRCRGSCTETRATHSAHTIGHRPTLPHVSSAPGPPAHPHSLQCRARQRGATSPVAVRQAPEDGPRPPVPHSRQRHPLHRTLPSRGTPTCAHCSPSCVCPSQRALPAATSSTAYLGVGRAAPEPPRTSRPLVAVWTVRSARATACVSPVPWDCIDHTLSSWRHVFWMPWVLLAIFVRSSPRATAVAVRSMFSNPATTRWPWLVPCCSCSACRCRATFCA